MRDTTKKLNGALFVVVTILNRSNSFISRRIAGFMLMTKSQNKNDAQQMIDTSVSISTRSHTQLNNDGAVMGVKYSYVIRCKGHVFTTASLFKERETVEKELEELKNELRNSDIHAYFPE